MNCRGAWAKREGARAEDRLVVELGWWWVGGSFPCEAETVA